MGQEGVKDIAIWVVGLAEFSRILWPSKIWQKWQIAVDYSKLRSYAQSLLTKLVEIGSGVLRVCLVILHLIALVVYRWQPQKKSC